MIKRLLTALLVIAFVLQGFSVTFASNIVADTVENAGYAKKPDPNYVAPSPIPVPKEERVWSMTKQPEKLNRGLIAIKGENGIFVSWRLLGWEPEAISFNLYRDGVQVNVAPIATTTNFVDAQGNEKSKYYVCAILDGTEQKKSETVGVWENSYLAINVKKPEVTTVEPPASAKDQTPIPIKYGLGDGTTGDLDGDGQYEIVVIWEANSKDNSQPGVTAEVLIDAYKLDGTLMWRINLGKNIRSGAHYVDLMVYDLDGDGKAELACRTGDGTIDGTGKILGNEDKDYRNSAGYILTGPEFYSVFSGPTGRVLDTVSYEPPRGTVSDWGDSYGNRVDRFLACVAYLDGERPSVIACRGYYTQTHLVAYDFRDGKLTMRWNFSSLDPKNQTTDKDGRKLIVEGQGNHNLSVGDVDFDGKDEITYGAMALDDDGKLLYSTNLGHGDAIHLSDLDPDREGYELLDVHEGAAYVNTEFRDARTGALIWGLLRGGDNGRGMSANVDPRYKGSENWAGLSDGMYTAKGDLISRKSPSSKNFLIQWDGDLEYELLDHIWSKDRGVPIIEKWDWNNGKANNMVTFTGTHSNNWTKGNPVLQADLFGDYREEVVLPTDDNSELRIYSTTIPTTHRIYTLMHDHIYRLGVAWQCVGYNQPPHTSFYMGSDSNEPLPGDSNRRPETDFTSLYIGSNKALVKGELKPIDSENEDVTPIIKDGKTLVPVRFISEAFGAKVDWNEETKQITISLKDIVLTNHLIKMEIDSKKINVNETDVNIDVAPQVINGRTMVPLRALTEALGKYVSWDDRGLIMLCEIPSLFDTDRGNLAKEQTIGILKN